MRRSVRYTALALGLLVAACSSTGAVKSAKVGFRAAKAVGAKEKATFEYYAAKAYLELAQFAAAVEDHGQARVWGKQAEAYAAEASRKAQEVSE